ncbi:MAG TPA: VOC family protein [Thermomicrobiales bacterium]|nr:VOC family protein [Thermomicrobiales bacterium]
MSNHSIVHIEIPVNDQETAGKFYSDLFGWQYQAYPEMNYALFTAGDGPGGGFPLVSEMHQVNQPLIYVSTDDIEASLAKAESLGGSMVVPKTEIPGQGWFGIFSDPTGNNIALYTPMSQD